MGWRNSLPVFSSATETVADIANARLRDRTYSPSPHNLDQMAADAAPTLSLRAAAQSWTPGENTAPPARGPTRPSARKAVNAPTAAPTAAPADTRPQPPRGQPPPAEKAADAPTAAPTAARPQPPRGQPSRGRDWSTAQQPPLPISRAAKPPPSNSSAATLPSRPFSPDHWPARGVRQHFC